MAVIKWYFQIFITCSIVLMRINAAKSKDEGRPYEFGFTIDGQQHRHERKDANGIIQGEFGFITADGVYHVTTYATDENGAFRILSMRNIKISGPLDGTKAGEYKTKPLPTGNVATQKPVTQQQNLPAKTEHPPTVNQVQVSTRKPLVFMTHPTIRPACAGCGYITRATTTKKPSTPTEISVEPGLSKPITFVNQNQEFNNHVVQTHQSIQNDPQSGQNSIANKEEHKQVGFPNTAQKLPGNKPNDPNTNQINANTPNTNPYTENKQNVNAGHQNINQHSPTPGPHTQSNQILAGGKISSPYVENNYNSNISNPNVNQYDTNSAQPFPNNQNFAGNFPTDKPSDPTPGPHTQSNQILAGGQITSPYVENNYKINIGNPNVNQYDTNSAQPYPNNQNFAGNFPTDKPSDPTPGPHTQSNQILAGGQITSPYVENNYNSNIGNPNVNQYDTNSAQPYPNNQNFAGNFPTNKPSDFPTKTPSHSIVDDIKVENNAIVVPNNPPIPIKDKYPGMVDGLPAGITQTDISDILYKFNYTIGFHGHYEKGLRNGTKIGGYFVNGRDGISRVVTYVADENGYRPKFKLVNLGLDSPLTPKEDTEKTFGLQSFEFVWYPLK